MKTLDGTLGALLLTAVLAAPAMAQPHGRFYRSDLPPGLAKRNGDLPPGLQKHLYRTGHLPPGLEKRYGSYGTWDYYDRPQRSGNYGTWGYYDRPQHFRTWDRDRDRDRVEWRSDGRARYLRRRD